ncbi:MAG: AbrB/MazE/SpoVT family DNA-binding domain-containing protein [Oscillospiraceae bacterium]|nr:AbrB/MazE/SpoVT family DNA-binding domain-containing protein [Oscillospiraceae bacterium]
MIKYKKLSKARSISIPKDMAAHLDLAPGTAVDLTAAKNGDLIIRRHAPTCRFCGGAENVKHYRDIMLCPLCATELYREVCGNG